MDPQPKAPQLEEGFLVVPFAAFQCNLHRSGSLGSSILDLASVAHPCLRTMNGIMIAPDPRTMLLAGKHCSIFCLQVEKEMRTGRGAHPQVQKMLQ